MIYMFLSNNPSSGDINLSNLSCSKLFFSKNSLRKIIRVSYTLDLDQDRQNVDPDLGPNCLLRLSADNQSCHKQEI